MIEGNGLKRRAFGRLYWLPDVAALLLVLYAATAIFTYWKTGDLKALAFGSAVLAMAVTMVTAAIRSYTVMVFDLSLCILNVVANVRSDHASWTALALVCWLCLLNGGLALVPRVSPKCEDVSPGTD